MNDDRIDVTPKRCCYLCWHLVDNDASQSEQCLRDYDETELATYDYEWDNPDDMFDLIRKSCPRWKTKEGAEK